MSVCRFRACVAVCAAVCMAGVRCAGMRSLHVVACSLLILCLVLDMYLCPALTQVCCLG